MNRSIISRIILPIALIFSTSFAAKNTQESPLYLDTITSIIKKEIKQIQKTLNTYINDDCMFDSSAPTPKEQLETVLENFKNLEIPLDQKTSSFAKDLDTIADHIKTKIETHFTKNSASIKDFYNKNTGNSFTVSAIMHLSPDDKNNQNNNYVLSTTIDPKLAAQISDTTTSTIKNAFNCAKNVLSATKRCILRQSTVGAHEASMLIKIISEQVANLFRTCPLIHRTLVDSTYFESHDIVVKIEKQALLPTSSFQKDAYVFKKHNIGDNDEPFYQARRVVIALIGFFFVGSSASYFALPDSFFPPVGPNYNKEKMFNEIYNNGKPMDYGKILHNEKLREQFFDFKRDGKNNKKIFSILKHNTDIMRCFTKPESTENLGWVCIEYPLNLDNIKQNYTMTVYGPQGMKKDVLGTLPLRLEIIKNIEILENLAKTHKPSSDNVISDKEFENLENAPTETVPMQVGFDLQQISVTPVTNQTAPGLNSNIHEQHRRVTQTFPSHIQFHVSKTVNTIYMSVKTPLIQIEDNFLKNKPAEFLIIFNTDMAKQMLHNNAKHIKSLIAHEVGHIHHLQNCNQYLAHVIKTSPTAFLEAISLVLAGHTIQAVIPKIQDWEQQEQQLLIIGIAIPTAITNKILFRNKISTFINSNIQVPGITQYTKNNDPEINADLSAGEIANPKHLASSFLRICAYFRSIQELRSNVLISSIQTTKLS